MIPLTTLLPAASFQSLPPLLSRFEVAAPDGCGVVDTIAELAADCVVAAAAAA